MISIYSPWLGAYGWSIFIFGLIAAIILFSIKKRFYPVMYLVSIATYIFTIGFVIEAFNLGKEWVLGLLALSAVVFISLGVYFSRKHESASKTVKSRSKKKKR